MQYLTNDGQSSLFVSSHEGPPPPKAVITSVIKHEFRYKKDGILFTYHSFCFSFMGKPKARARVSDIGTYIPYSENMY